MTKEDLAYWSPVAALFVAIGGSCGFLMGLFDFVEGDRAGTLIRIPFHGALSGTILFCLVMALSSFVIRISNRPTR